MQSADFLSKLDIALKEADETTYWLDLLHATDYLDDKMFDSLNNDCVELIKMLTAIIKTLKEKQTINCQLSIINWILAADYLPPVEDVEALPEGEDKED